MMLHCLYFYGVGTVVLISSQGLRYNWVMTTSKKYAKCGETVRKIEEQVDQNREKKTLEQNYKEKDRERARQT